jgi:hypothetical protein
MRNRTRRSSMGGEFLTRGIGGLCIDALISAKVQGTEAVRLRQGIALSYLADAVALLLYIEPLAFDNAESPPASLAEPLRTVVPRSSRIATRLSLWWFKISNPSNLSCSKGGRCNSICHHCPRSGLGSTPSKIYHTIPVVNTVKSLPGAASVQKCSMSRIKARYSPH